MSSAFTLSVPLDSRYRILAPEVAGKYVELLGGGPSDAEGLAAALTAALDALAGRARGDGQVDLVFRREAGLVEVELRCEGASSVVRHSLPTLHR
jgi:hypothetical protein